MKKLFLWIVVVVTCCLIVLNVCKLIEMKIACVVCGKPTYQENLFCRFASNFDKNFMHDYCARHYKFSQGKFNGNLSD